MNDTETIIQAMRILSCDIHSEDGVANAAIGEAADRLEKLAAENDRLQLDILDVYNAELDDRSQEAWQMLEKLATDVEKLQQAAEKEDQQ